jgi:hypothetical protein
LGEAFIADLYADWQQHGRQVIETGRINKPKALFEGRRLALAKTAGGQRGLV